MSSQHYPRPGLPSGLGQGQTPGSNTTGLPGSQKNTGFGHSNLHKLVLNKLDLHSNTSVMLINAYQIIINVYLYTLLLKCLGSVRYFKVFERSLLCFSF